MKNASHLVSVSLLLPLVISCTDNSGHLTSFGITMLVEAIVFVVVAVFAIIYRQRKTEQQSKAIKDAISEQNGFTETNAFRGDSVPYLYYLGIDDTKKKAIYVLDDLKVCFDFKDVVSAEICDGELASIYVHVVLQNQAVSSFDITCYKILSKKSYDSSQYIHSYEKAHKIYYAFMSMIHTANSKSIHNQDTIVDQIKDLAGLHEQGIITDEEFSAMKRKLIEE